MSISLPGVNFVAQKITPSSDTALYRAAQGDGILAGCGMTAAGSSLQLAAGWLLLGGKEIPVPAQSVPVTEALSGYARLVVTVDLTRTATAEVFDQVKLDVEYASSILGFASLQQEDLLGSGSVYQQALCVLSLGASGVTGIVRQLGRAAARPDAYSLTLPAADWDGTSLQVAFPQELGAVHIDASPAPASWLAWRDCGLRLVSTGPGVLNFAADAAPAEDLTAQILLFG